MTAHRMTRSEFTREIIALHDECRDYGNFGRLACELVEAAGVEWLPEKRRLKVGDVIDRDTDLASIEWPSQVGATDRVGDLWRRDLYGRWFFDYSPLRDAEVVRVYGPLSVVWVPGGDNDE